jgi:hypothetical protein
MSPAIGLPHRRPGTRNTNPARPTTAILTSIRMVRLLITRIALERQEN